jgi:glucokinase
VNGRPGQRARLSRADPLTVGIDVGGTKVLAGVVDPTGRVLTRERRVTPGRDPQAVEDTIVDLITMFTATHDVAAVGIGAAGFVDASRSRVMFAPHLNWRDEPLRDEVARRVRLPVVVDNDANAAAYAESRFGAGRGHRFVLCITLGTGIGGALVIDQRVFRGSNGMAGEFGHMQVVPGGHRCPCGNRGCWEQYASGNALVRDARELVEVNSPVAHRLRQIVQGDATQLTGAQVTRAAMDGDPAATELLADIGRWLGVGLAGMAAAFDPDCIVVGGGVSAAGELLLNPTRVAFARHLVGRGHRQEPPILEAQLGRDASFIGAAEMARSAARRSRQVRRRRRKGEPLSRRMLRPFVEDRRSLSEER